MKVYQKKNYKQRFVQNVTRKQNPSITISLSRYNTLVQMEAFVGQLKRQMAFAKLEGDNAIFVHDYQLPD